MNRKSIKTHFYYAQLVRALVVIAVDCTYRSGYAAISTLLSLPTHLSDLVDAIGSRWLSGRPTKCAKLLSQHLENLEKSSEE